MYMINKCAKFHVDTPSGDRLKFIPAIKFILASVIELSDMAKFVHNFDRNPLQASNFGDIFDQLIKKYFIWNFFIRFSHKMISTSFIPWCKK